MSTRREFLGVTTTALVATATPTYARGTPKLQYVTSVNAKMTTVRIPEVDIGIISLMNAPQRVNPSTIAASSRSFGISLKKPISSHVENGIVKLG